MSAHNAAEIAPHTSDDVLADLSPVGRNILEAARAVVVEGGLDGLSLQAVASEAGVHKSAIAYHFGSKDGLLQQLAELLFGEYAADTGGPAAPASDPALRVAHRFRVLRALAKDGDYWSLAHAVWSLTRLDPSFAARAEELKRSDLGRVATSLGLSAADPDDLALVDAIDSSVAGLALDFTFGWGVATIDASLDRLEEAFTPLLLRAIARRQPDRSTSAPGRAGDREGEAG